MPLYAELQIGKELIIYPMPVPRDKEHYKVNRILEGSTVQVNGIAPLHLFNGELLYAKETGRIQRVEFNVKPNDTAAKEQAERTMNQLVEAMKSDQKEADDILSKQTPDEVREISKSVQSKIMEMSETMPPERRHKIKKAFATIAAAEKSAEIIKDHADNPTGNLYDKLGEAMEDAGLLNKTQYPSGGFSFAEPKKKDDLSDETQCKHRNTDYFIGTGIVCRDCKKKLRV
jgi:gas vesicle protein